MRTAEMLQLRRWLLFLLSVVAMALAAASAGGIR